MAKTRQLIDTVRTYFTNEDLGLLLAASVKKNLRDTAITVGAFNNSFGEILIQDRRIIGAFSRLIKIAPLRVAAVAIGAPMLPENQPYITIDVDKGEDSLTYLYNGKGKWRLDLFAGVNTPYDV